MLDTIDACIEEVKDLTNIDSSICTLESDFKPLSDDRNEYAIYLIKDGEVYKHVLAELTHMRMKQFIKSPVFPRYLHQCLDKLSIKAGYRTSIKNNDPLTKDVSDV